MARAQIKCRNCKRKAVYTSDAIVNIGTAFSQIWAVYCLSCDSLMRTDGKKQSNSFPKNSELAFDFDAESGGVVVAKKVNAFRSNKKGSASERAERGDIREYWVQMFFAEHYRDYRFK